jgi:predicted RNA polymerase sigma factor
MELQASRSRARVGPRGEPILLNDQDRSRWDYVLVTRGLAALDRAISLKAPLGPYTLQAAIAACHARARTAADTDWKRIVDLYGALARVTPSPIVELNRAVAIAETEGPEAALALTDELDLEQYQYFHSTRADLLRRVGRRDEARAAYERALALAHTEPERRFLRRRIAEVGASSL